MSSSPRIVVPPAREARALASELIELRVKAEFFPDTVTRNLIQRIALHLRARLRRCLHGVKTRALEREPSRSRGSIVQRAEDFFREHLGEAVSISELAAATGVSDRTLRQAFHQVCLTSPKKYLRLWQLQQVRRSLRAGPNAHAAVTTAALQYGFTEFGRFAAEYRTLFGEVPSETLHRARRDWGAAPAV
jgi:AraC family ethanolamine operon transcriptional activator